MKIELRKVVARHAAAKPGAAAALRQVSLSIADGEQVAIIGPSGAGKTTLLQLLACALPPLQGQYRLNEQSPWAMPRRALQRLRGQLCLAPQVPPLPPRQRVVTAVLAGRLPAMGLLQSIRSLFYPSDIPAAHQALQRFDLGEKIFERVDRLSGGERQRVGLARLLLAPASLWLVDEPLSALDPTRARLALKVLVDEAKARKLTLVASLHQVDVALVHFPRIVALREGAVVFDLPSEQVSQAMLATLYAQHEHELQSQQAEPGDSPAEPASPVLMQCR
ncbi:MAG: phosphonate ABC transporter ATP-binding protein [Burkholderiales bacterium]